jgi:hypothetical protein
MTPLTRNVNLLAPTGSPCGRSDVIEPAGPAKSRRVAVRALLDVERLERSGVGELHRSGLFDDRKYYNWSGELFTKLLYDANVGAPYQVLGK